MFGIGSLEFLFLLLLTFLLLGPEDSVKVARGLGRALRFVYRSTLWRAIARMRYEFEKIVQEEIRRASIAEDLQQLKDWQRSMEQESKENRIFPHPPGAMSAASMTPLSPEPATPSDTVSAKDHEPTSST